MDMKREYYEDVELFSSNVVLFWSLAFLVFLFTLPIYTPNYYVYLLNLIMVHVILAVGLNILVGYTGQISLGFIAAFFGFILGLPALRLEGPYLAIATLGFGLTIMHVIGRWDIFGGRMGIHAPPLDIGAPKIGVSWVLESDISMYYLILIIAIIMVVAARNIMKTRVGRAFVAIRDSDIAAEVMGVNLTTYKTLAFAISAFYAGIAGGLFGFVCGFFDPFTFNFILSIIFLVMVVVGGLGSILGAIMGATLITYLQYDLLKNVSEAPFIGDFLVSISKRWLTVVGLENFGSIALGLIMIGIIVFEPLGMYGVWIRIKKYWMTWPF